MSESEEVKARKLIKVGNEEFVEEWLIDFIAESRKLIANVKSMRESENEH